MRGWLTAALAGGLLAAVLLVVVTWLRRRRARRPHALQSLDTVMAWTPEPTRVLTQAQRQAYQTLVQALPDHTVLAQVSLARFLRVPGRRSYGEWLGRVGYLSADLLVCDKATNVIAVVEVLSSRDSERSRQRHERMTRVLTAARIRVIVWNEGALPDAETARAQVLAEAPASVRSPFRSGGQRLGTLPVAETSELDAPPAHEPPASTWFDDFDSSADTPDRDKN